MIISFAQTIPAVLDQSKTVTRRFWDDGYAKRFSKGTMHDAWDRSPRTRKGKRRGRIIILKDPYKEPLGMMSDEHFEREGGKRFWKNKEEFIEMMGGAEAAPWVIEFELVWAF